MSIQSQNLANQCVNEAIALEAAMNQGSILLSRLLAKGCIDISGNVISQNPGFQPALDFQGNLSYLTSGNVQSFVNGLQALQNFWGSGTPSPISNIRSILSFQ